MHKKHNKHGSGLGLLIVKDLLTQINSKIEFESEENKGSKFWFDIEVNYVENEIILDKKISIY